MSPAGRTDTGGLAQPADSDPCTGAEAPATLAEVHHFTNDFMAWNNPLMTGRQIAVRIQAPLMLPVLASGARTSGVQILATPPLAALPSPSIEDPELTDPQSRELERGEDHRPAQVVPFPHGLGALHQIGERSAQNLIDAPDQLGTSRLVGQPHATINLDTIAPTAAVNWRLT